METFGDGIKSNYYGKVVHSFKEVRRLSSSDETARSTGNNVNCQWPVSVGKLKRQPESSTFNISLGHATLATPTWHDGIAILFGTEAVIMPLQLLAVSFRSWRTWRCNANEIESLVGSIDRETQVRHQRLALQMLAECPALLCHRAPNPNFCSPGSRPSARSSVITSAIFIMFMTLCGIPYVVSEFWGSPLVPHSLMAAIHMPHRRSDLVANQHHLIVVHRNYGAP